MRKTDLPIFLFKSPKDWASGLDKNHAKSSDMWMRLFKKGLRCYLYSIASRRQTAKEPETRAMRMKTILEMLKRGEKFH